MQAVFYPPMLSDRTAKLARIVGQAGDEVAALNRHLIAYVAFRFGQPDDVQVLPVLALLQPTQFATRPITTYLNSSVVSTQGFVILNAFAVTVGVPK